MGKLQRYADLCFAVFYCFQFFFFFFFFLQLMTDQEIRTSLYKSVSKNWHNLNFFADLQVGLVAVFIVHYIVTNKKKKKKTHIHSNSKNRCYANSE